MKGGTFVARVVFLALSSFLVSCCAAANGDTGAVTMGDLIKPIKNPGGARPANGDYYAALLIKFDDSTPINTSGCLDRSTLSFIRRLLKDNQSAQATLNLDISHTLQTQPTLPLVLFSAKVDENAAANTPGCVTGPINNGAQLTAFLPSKNGDGLKLNFTFASGTNVDSQMIKTAADDTTSLVNMVATAAGFGLVSTTVRAAISAAAAHADAARNALGTQASAPQIAENFYFFPSAGQSTDDAWNISIVNPTDTASGAHLSGWQPKITTYFSYKASLFTKDNVLEAPSDIIDDPLLPSSLAELTSIRAYVNTVGTIGGFNPTSFATAKSAGELTPQCQALKQWLDTFLVAQDRTAALAALLQHSPFGSDPNTRSDDCLKSSETAALPPAFQFAAPTPHVASRDEIVGARTDALNDAVNRNDGDNDAFQKLAVTPFVSFRYAPTSGPSIFGAKALTEIRSFAYAVRCTTAGQSQQDPTMIAGILAGDSKKQPVILHYNSGSNGTLFEIEAASVDDIRAELQLDPSVWPANKPSCKL